MVQELQPKDINGYDYWYMPLHKLNYVAKKVLAIMFYVKLITYPCFEYNIDLIDAPQTCCHFTPKAVYIVWRRKQYSTSPFYYHGLTLIPNA